LQQLSYLFLDQYQLFVLPYFIIYSLIIFF